MNKLFLVVFATIVFSCNSNNIQKTNIKQTDSKIKKDSINQNLSIKEYLLPYTNYEDSVVRYFPSSFIADSLAMYEGVKTRIFNVFINKKTKNLLICINDTSIFNKTNFKIKNLKLFDNSGKMTIKYRTAIDNHLFKLIKAKEYEITDMIIYNKLDSIFISSEGNFFDITFRDNFVRFSNMFYIGMNKDDFFKKWGFMPIKESISKIVLCNTACLFEGSYVYDTIRHDYLNPQEIKYIKNILNLNSSEFYSVYYTLYFQNDTIKQIRILSE